MVVTLEAPKTTEVVGMLSGIKDDTKEEIKVETATEDGSNVPLMDGWQLLMAGVLVAYDM